MSELHWVLVAIDWLPFEKGGRKRIPTGEQYRCNTTIEAEGWSIVFDLSDEPMRLSFLVEWAPRHLLVPGFTLPIQEGARTVGTATVLENK